MAGPKAGGMATRMAGSAAIPKENKNGQHLFWFFKILRCKKDIRTYIK